ncbi:P27 family phage terminase small subunit [Variovorax boronicumulans]|uniref:P27 family phage terminase small subunit n=1 Tax=Variovorax boronicumulans TaxID=436515 RepID=UPI00339AA8C6
MTTRKRPPRTKAPAGLSSEARALWTATNDEYSFETAADFALLCQLCETLDRLREIQRAIKTGGLMVAGSQGQLRMNPLLQAEEAARRTILAHVRALRLTSTLEI